MAICVSNVHETIMSTTLLFKKHFGNNVAVDLKHPNVESFFEELNQECIDEDLKNPTQLK